MKGPGISRFTYKRNYRGSGERQGERTCTGLQLQEVHAVTGRAGRCRTGVRHGSAENGIPGETRAAQNEKSPLGRLFDQGGVNPAATYSPGPEGQVPSAI